MAYGETYEEFVEKFKPKKTTDDCFTPAPIMDAVNDYVEKRYNLHQEYFVRPFFPGGDYEGFEYGPKAVVVDNPPFSMLSQIIDFYTSKGIKYFLFAPSLTMFSTIYDRPCTAVCVDCRVTYDNGANVNTSFVTNLEPAEVRAKSDPELFRIIEAANKEARKEYVNDPPKYSYPANIITGAMLNKLSRCGVEFEVPRAESACTRTLDNQRPKRKGIYGSGLLISDRVADAKVEAQNQAALNAIRRPAEQNEAIVWELSQREQDIIKGLGEQNG